MNEEQYDKKSEEKSSGGLLSIIGLVVVAGIAGVIGKTCGRSVSTKMLHSSSSASVNPAPSVSELSLYEIAGLNIKLPAPPKSTVMDLPSEVREFINSMTTYESKMGATQLTITHAVYKIPEVNLDGSADGAISQVRLLPGVTGFVSSKEETTIDGLDGRIINMNYRNSGYAVDQYGLVFVRGSEAWQVQIIGVNTSNKDDLELLRDEIFSNITIAD